MAQDNFSLLNANLDDTLRPLFADKYFLGAIALFFALYAGWLAPKLPNSVIYFFDTIPGKLLFIFIIAFVASRRVENSFQVALVVSVMFLVTLTVLNKVKMQEAFQNLSMEHFNLMGTMQNIMQGQQQEDYAAEDGKEDKPCKQPGNICDVGLECNDNRCLKPKPTPTPGELDQACKQPNNECNDGLECNNENPRKCKPRVANVGVSQGGSVGVSQGGSLGGGSGGGGGGSQGGNQVSPSVPSVSQSNNNGMESFEAFSNYNNYSDY